MLTTSRRGVFITVEGADGVGKATQVTMLAERLRANGREVRVFSFPQYDTALGNLISRALRDKTRLPDTADHSLMLQALMLTDKCAASTEIARFLADGVHVVCDRWWQSAVVYGGAMGADADWLMNVSQVLLPADWNILLDVPLALVRERRPVPEDKLEASDQLQAEVRLRYHVLWNTAKFAHAGLASKGLWAQIPNTGTPEETHKTIWDWIV